MKNVTINRCILASKNIYRKCWSETRVQIFKQGKMAIKKRRRVVKLQKGALSNNLSFLRVLIQKIKALKSWINHRKQSNPRSRDISLKGRGKHSPVPEQHAHTHTHLIPSELFKVPRSAADVCDLEQSADLSKSQEWSSIQRPITPQSTAVSWGWASGGLLNGMHKLSALTQISSVLKHYLKTPKNMTIRTASYLNSSIWRRLFGDLCWRLLDVSVSQNCSDEQIKIFVNMN